MTARQPAYSGLSQEQAFLFDTTGYLVLPGALPMDLVEDLRSSLRHPTEQFAPVASSEHPLHWGTAWRTLLDLPPVSVILEDLVGNHAMREHRVSRFQQSALPTFRLDHINVHTHVSQGYAGMPLHGNWDLSGGSQFFRYHDGRFYNGLVVVAFELYDTRDNGGAFCCIPGSHKSNLPIPEQWVMPGQAPADLVRKIPAAAGDAIVFTETLIHGTAPWQLDTPRKTLFYKYSPHGTSWSADYLDPDDFRQYEDMDDRRLAILEPPNARYRGRPTRPVRRDEDPDKSSGKD